MIVNQWHSFQYILQQHLPTFLIQFSVKVKDTGIKNVVYKAYIPLIVCFRQLC